MHEKMDTPGIGDALTPVLEVMAAKANIVLASVASKKLPLMIVEALLVALYVHRNSLASRTDAELIQAYQVMLAQPTFAEGARYAVSSAANVKDRLHAAVTAFASA
jgi:hypothetical protein